MKQQVEIEIPDNMELVDVNPTFRERKLSYADCVRNLQINNTGKHLYVSTKANEAAILSFFSDLQIKKLEAINKMLVVAKYLNGDWEPDWKNHDEGKFYVYVEDDGIKVSYVTQYKFFFCHFKTENLAKQAIDILGEDTIRCALGDY